MPIMATASASIETQSMSDKAPSYIHPTTLSSHQKHLIWPVKLQRSKPSMSFTRYTLYLHPNQFLLYKVTNKSLP